jgi:hypothetical protein
MIPRDPDGSLLARERTILATRPRALLAGAIALAVVLVALTVSAVTVLSAPDAADPVTMTPALAPVTPQPVRVDAVRPGEPKPATRAPVARPAPKHTPVQDAPGQAYQNGMDLARHVTGGGPWSGVIP